MYFVKHMEDLVVPYIPAAHASELCQLHFLAVFLASTNLLVLKISF